MVFSLQVRVKGRKEKLLDAKPQIDSLLTDVRLLMQTLFDFFSQYNDTVRMHLSKQGSADL